MNGSKLGLAIVRLARSDPYVVVKVGEVIRRTCDGIWLMAALNLRWLPGLSVCTRTPAINNSLNPDWRETTSLLI